MPENGIFVLYVQRLRSGGRKQARRDETDNNCEKKNEYVLQES